MIKFLKYLTTIFVLIIVLIIFTLSTIGYETNKFNNLIYEKVNKFDNNIKLKFKNILFKLDFFTLSLSANIDNPEIIYVKNKIPISNLNIFFNLSSLVERNIKFRQIQINTKEFDHNVLKDILQNVRPSIQSSILKNYINEGLIKLNADIFYMNGEISNYEVDGYTRDLNLNFKDIINIKDARFIFSLNSKESKISNLFMDLNSVPISSGELIIDHKENYIVKTNFKTKKEIDSNSISKIKKNFNIKNNLNFLSYVDINLNHDADFVFDKTFKLIDYNYNLKGEIPNANLKFSNKNFKNFIEDQDLQLIVNKGILGLNLSYDNKLDLNIDGEYSLNNNKYENFNFKITKDKKKFNLTSSLDFNRKVNFSFINYSNLSKKSNILFDLEINDRKYEFKKIIFSENKNSIDIRNLILNENLEVIKFDEISINTFKENRIQNDFKLSNEKELLISGSSFDSTNLVKLMGSKQKSNISFDISKNVKIDLKNVYFKDGSEIKDFYLIGILKNGKFESFSSKGNFSLNEFLEISLKKNLNDKRRYFEIYSDVPEIFLRDYKFFDGVKGGKMIFNSAFDDKGSTSKLMIENFKVINAPGIVKLLTLADFQGLLDTLNGDGIGFNKMEIKFSNNKSGIKLEELYALGPSLSILMEGYTEHKTNLISLRGTMVPAKTLNKILSSIPVVGDILIPKEIGEGLFGVSFKIKGTDKDLKTTVNPLKTITPRFITKALEKKTSKP